MMAKIAYPSGGVGIRAGGGQVNAKILLDSPGADNRKLSYVLNSSLSNAVFGAGDLG